MNQEEIEELKKLMSEASPRPWRKFMHIPCENSSHPARHRQCKVDRKLIVALVNAAPELLLAAERLQIYEQALVNIIRDRGDIRTIREIAHDALLVHPRPTTTIPSGTNAQLPERDAHE